MQWQLGGNFEPVFMICEIDWRACPAAIANYIWTEIVTDVVDCMVNDTWLIWRIVAIISITVLILRLLYRKLRCADEVARNNETLNKVGCKMQDLELKINILTYKMQYGTWPMPHQVRGPNAKKQLRNIRLTLSNYDDRNVWIKRMLLGPPSISCTSCSNGDTTVQRLNEVFNTNNTCNFKSDRSESTNSNTKSTRSSSGRSVKRWRRTVRNSDIIKMREERQSRSEKFLLRYRDAEAMRDRSKNMLPDHCNKYLESMEDCKKFLQNLKNGNQSLGLIGDSSETNDESITNYDCKEKVSQAQRTTVKESYTKSDEIDEKIVNVVKLVSQKLRCSSQTRRSDENNLNASNVVASPTKSIISTNEPTTMTDTMTSHFKQTTNQSQPKLLRSSQHTLRLVHRKLESLHNLLQKYNSTGSIRTSNEKKKTRTRPSSENFVRLSNTDSAEHRQASKIFHENWDENKSTPHNKTRNNKMRFRHSPNRNKVVFRNMKQDVKSQDYPEQNSLTSEFTFDESEREGNKSVDSISENSFLSLQSHSDTVVYDNEKYHRPIELSESDVSDVKRTVSWSDISTGMSYNPRLQSDNSPQLSAYSNAITASIGSEKIKYPSSSNSCQKTVCDEMSTSSVCSQSNDTEDQTFKSTRSSTSDLSKLSDFEARSTIALLREALQVKKTLIRQLDSHVSSQNEICLAAIDSRRKFESKLLDAITEESPNTSTAKTSRTFVFIEAEKKSERTTESGDPSKDSALTTAGNQLVTSNLRSSNYRSPASKHLTLSNLIENTEHDLVRRALQSMNCPSSGISLGEAEFNSRSVAEEMARNSKLVEEWERFCVESDKIENKAEVETPNTNNMITDKSCTESDKSTDEKENESTAEESVSQESVESWKQSRDEPYAIDEDVAKEMLTTKNAVTRNLAVSWSNFCNELNKMDSEMKNDISEKKDVAKESINSRAIFCKLTKSSDNRLKISASMNLKENSDESTGQFHEASVKIGNVVGERSIAKDIDNLVGQRVNDVRYLTELFSQSQKEAIMDIQKEIQYQNESKSNATTEDTESSSDENSRREILNNVKIEEEHSTESKSGLEEEHVYDNRPASFESGQPSMHKYKNETVIDLTKKLDAGTADLFPSKDQTEATSTTTLNEDLQRVDTKTFDVSDNFSTQQSNQRETQLDQLSSIIPCLTDGTESYPEIISRESSLYFTNEPSITSKRLSKIATFNILTDKRSKKTDSTRSINAAQRCSTGKIGTKNKDPDVEAKSADPMAETMEHVDNKHSASVPSINFSSDTSASYVDANSASSFFNNPAINPTGTMQTSEKDIRTPSLTVTSLEKRAKIIRCNLPSSKYLKPTCFNEKFQTQEPGPSGSLSTQHLKHAKNSDLKGKSNLCLVESKTEVSKRAASKTTEQNFAKACKIESSSKCRLDTASKTVGQRNNSSDSIKSDAQFRLLTPEAKVSSKSCIPILKARLAKEGRPKSPARSPLTMTMLWTVKSTFKDLDSSEKIVKAEGKSNKVRSETPVKDDKEEGGEESKKPTLTDKHFVVVPEAKSMLYMQIFADRDRSLIRIVDPKTFLGYLRDRELKIQNVVHEDRSESLICRKNSFLTIIEQANDVNSKFLAIVPAGVDDDDLDENGAERVCVAKSGPWMDFRPVSVRRREIFVTAKPSVTHTSTSITDLRDECEGGTDKVAPKAKPNNVSVKAVRSRKTDMANECV